MVTRHPPFYGDFFLIPEQPDHLSLLVSFPVVFPLLQIFLQFPLFAVLPFALFLPCFPRYSLLSSFLLSFFHML